MVAWIDILTAKQARFFKPFIERYKSFVTTRDYSESLIAIKHLKIDCEIIGKHGKTSIEKLIFSVERTKQLLDWFLMKKPKFLISHGSVEATRISFQAGIPIFDFNDSPESIYVARLTSPLTELMIVPKDCGELFKKYGAQKVTEYDGLTPVTWLKRHEKDQAEVKRIGIAEDKINVLVREPAYLASHLEAKDQTFRKIINELKRIDGLNLIELERYKNKFIDLPSIIDKIDVVIATGSILGEAIVSGVPLIIDYYPIVQAMYKRFIKDGFMLHLTNIDDIVNEVKKYVRNPSKRREPLYKKMEDPLDIFDEIIKENYPHLLE